MEHTNDLIFILNKDVEIEYINKSAFKNLLGYLRDDIIGKSLIEFIHLTEQKIVHAIFNGNPQENAKLRIKDKNNSYHWYEFKIKIFIDHNGKKKFLIVAKNITKAENLEERLNIAKEMFRTVAEQWLMGICIIQDNHVKYINQQLSDLLGYTSEEILSWQSGEFFKTIHPDDRPMVLEQAKVRGDELNSGIRNYVARGIHKSGRIIWVDVWFKNIEYERRPAFLNTFIDITDKKIAEEKLKESEERYRLITESANDLIRVLDDRFEFEYINEKVHKRLLGYDKEDLIGQTNLPFLHPEDRKHAVRSTVRNLNRGYGSYQARFKDKNGNYKWFEFGGKIFYDSKGTKKILSIARDINERKSVEQKLMESEMKYRHLFNNSPYFIGLVDMNGNLIDCNMTINEFMSLHNKEHVIGKSFREILSLNEKNKYLMPVFSKFFIEASKGNKVEPYEFELFRSMDDSLWLRIEGSLIELNNKKMLQFIIQDITERKHAEIALQHAAHHWAITFDAMSDSVILLDLENRIVQCNKATLEILGKSNYHGIIGRPCWEVVHGTSEPVDWCPVKHMKITGNTESSTAQIGDKWFQISADPILDDESRLIGAVHVISDITERKKAEEKLKKSEEKYRDLVNSISDLLLEVDLKGKFTYASPQLYDMFGFTFDEIRGKRIHKFIHPEDLPRVAKTLKEGFETRTNLSVEYRTLHKDGHYIYASVKGAYMDNGRFYGVVRDISETKLAEQKLKESEEKYRLISENAYDLIGIFNTKLKYEYINEQAFKRDLGYTKNDIIGKSALKFIHPEDFQLTANLFKEGFQTGYGEAELRFRHKDGHWIWIDAKGRTFIDNKGELKALVLSRNISERKIAEQKLKESEKRYRLITDNSKEAVFIMDMNLKQTFASPASYEMLGYTSEELIGMSIQKTTTRASIRVLAEIYKEELAIEKQDDKDLNRSRRIEIQQIHKNGKIIDVEISLTFLRDDDNNAIGIIGLSRNISARKIAERKLKESEERYRLISENANDVIWTTDMSMNLTYVSPSTQNASGYSVEEMLNMKLDQYHTPASFKILIDKFKEELKIERRKDKDLNRIRVFEVEQIHKNGSIFNKEIVVTFLRDESQKAIGIVGVTRDITEKKEAERKLKESEKKYRKAYKRANYYKDLFAHDINNILQTINSSAELMRHYLSDSEKNKDVNAISKIINKQVMRGAKLITNIHTLSNLEDQDLSVEPIKINNQLKNSIEYIKKVYIDRDIDIQIHSPNEDFMVQANFLVQQAFDNLLSNAVKYNSNENLEISIDISKIIIEDVKYVKMEFKDNGIGVADERKDLIFKKYEREHKGGKGMGVGLSLVKKIIKNYKGKIWVEDKVKGDYTKGSNFIILIPDADKVNKNV